MAALAVMRGLIMALTAVEGKCGSQEILITKMLGYHLNSRLHSLLIDIGKNGDSIYEKVGNSLYYTCGSVSIVSAECS